MYNQKILFLELVIVFNKFEYSLSQQVEHDIRAGDSPAEMRVVTIWKENKTTNTDGCQAICGGE